MVKVGLIRCAGTLPEYPGTGCFKTTRGTGGKFSEYSDQDIEIIGMADCGGCPGRNATSGAANMVKKGAQVIYPATRAVKPISNPSACDHPEETARAIRDRTGVKEVMETH
jgi:predicted metal-binding protein